jgi:hypothetical protein
MFPAVTPFPGIRIARVAELDLCNQQLKTNGFAVHLEWPENRQTTTSSARRAAIRRAFQHFLKPDRSIGSYVTAAWLSPNRTL